MFDKDQLEESLGRETGAFLYWGARLAKISFIVACLGILLILFGAIQPGEMLTIIGINAGFIGLAVHYFAKVVQSSVSEVLQELYQDALTLHGKTSQFVRMRYEKFRKK